MFQANVRIVFSPSDFPTQDKAEMVRYIQEHGHIKALDDIFRLASVVPKNCYVKDALLEAKIERIHTEKKSTEVFFEIVMT